MALVSMGVYLFKKTALLRSLQAHCDGGSGYDFGHNVVPALIRLGRVFAYDFRDKATHTPHYWRDIGTIDAYYAASMDLVQADAPFDPYANAQRPSQPTRHPSMKMSTSSAPLHSNSELTRTVVSPGVQLEQGATIDESVLMPGVHIGKGAQLRRVIVEEGVHIPAGFRAGFDLNEDRKLHTVTTSGIVVISNDPAHTKPTVVNFAFNSTRMPAARTPEEDRIGGWVSIEWTHAHRQQEFLEQRRRLR
jgi:glucose-1-phosphate adenylyltransferase